MREWNLGEGGVRVEPEEGVAVESPRALVGLLGPPDPGASCSSTTCGSPRTSVTTT